MQENWDYKSNRTWYHETGLVRRNATTSDKDLNNPRTVGGDTEVTGHAQLASQQDT